MRNLLTRPAPGKSSATHTSSGFTVVEILVVVVVSGILTGLLFGPLNDLYTSNSKGLQQTVANADTNGALQQIKQVATASRGFSSTAGGITDPNSGDWSGTSVANRLMTSNYATWMDGTTRRLLTGGGGCTPESNYTVFFVKSGTLYKRTLTAKNITVPCGGASWEQKFTCPTIPAGTTPCEAIDAKLLTNVRSFTIQYYATASGTSTTTPEAAQSVQVTIEKEIKGYGGDARTVTGKLRINGVYGS